MSSELRSATQGEYRGDISRDTFFPAKHLRRVIAQQGRPCLDADVNEQAAIVLHQLQTLAADLIGWHGGPESALGFEVIPAAGRAWDFWISPGRYYAQGLPCEIEMQIAYAEQADYPMPATSSAAEKNLLVGGKRHLVYLDVWERHLTHHNDARLREVALGEGDSATRTRLTWQLKALPLDLTQAQIVANTASRQDFLELLNKNGADVRPGTARLRARTREPPAEPSGPCAVAPSARYRGVDNRLYRIEIHQSGLVGKATYKVSRDNSSAALPVAVIGSNRVRLLDPGLDTRLGLAPLEVVEIVDDEYTLLGRTEPLRQVKRIDRDRNEVTLDGPLPAGVGQDPARHPLLRRWDHKPVAKNADGALSVTEADGETDDKWIALEDGILIQFPKPQAGEQHLYRNGDYWLIPARASGAGVEWLQQTLSDGTTVAAGLRPHGVQHHYAPMAIVNVDTAGVVQHLADLRRKFAALAK